MKTQYVGIDIAKKHLDVDLEGKVVRIENTTQAITGLLTKLPAHTHLVCEATGGYESTLLSAAFANNQAISMVNPERVRAHARSAGKLAKTDRIDALLISDYARVHHPAPLCAPDQTRQRLRALVRSREHLLELKTLETNWSEHQAAHPLIEHQAKARAAQIEEQIAQTEQAIRELIQTHQTLRTTTRQLGRLCGVGEVTIWTTLADLPELGTLEKGQAGALCGLVPYARDSGSCSKPRHIQCGRARLRRVLYMAALSASIHNPVLKNLYSRLRSRGKLPKVALIAVARRMIETMNIILKKPNFLLAS